MKSSKEHFRLGFFRKDRRYLSFAKRAALGLLLITLGHTASCDNQSANTLDQTGNQHAEVKVLSASQLTTKPWSDYQFSAQLKVRDDMFKDINIGLAQPPGPTPPPPESLWIYYGDQTARTCNQFFTDTDRSLDRCGVP